MGSGYFGQSEAPPPRQLGSEIGQIADVAPQIFDAERDYGRQVGQDQLDLSKQFMWEALRAYPQLAAAEREQTRLQRIGDNQQLQRLGPAMQRAIGAINPDWQKSLTSLNEAAGHAMDPSALLKGLNATAQSGLESAGELGPSQLRTMLTDQATHELALGRELSPEQERDVQQAARAAYSSRGIVDSNPALIGEVMARDSAGTARQDARRQFASAVQQLGQSEDESLLRRWAQYAGVGQGVEGLNQQQVGAGRNMLISAVGANQQALQPVLGFFGRTGVSPTAGGSVLSAAPNIIGAGTAAMNPVLNYGSDLFNTNFNSEAATRISNANNMAAIHGAIIGAVGNLAGGAAGACWVAREVFGNERHARSGTLMWQLFREWVLLRAPAAFRELYLARGERFAEWLHRSAEAKRAVRDVMEAILKETYAV